MSEINPKNAHHQYSENNKSIIIYMLKKYFV